MLDAELAGCHAALTCTSSAWCVFDLLVGLPGREGGSKIGGKHPRGRLTVTRPLCHVRVARIEIAANAAACAGSHVMAPKCEIQEAPRVLPARARLSFSASCVWAFVRRPLRRQWDMMGSLVAWTLSGSFRNRLLQWLSQSGRCDLAAPRARSGPFGPDRVSRLGPSRAPNEPAEPRYRNASPGPNWFSGRGLGRSGPELKLFFRAGKRAYGPGPTPLR